MTKRPASRLVRTIQAGLLLLLALMPFHAFMSVWLGSLTHHQAIIQAWKDGLIAVLALLAAILLVHEPERLRQLRAPWIICAGAFALFAVLVTLLIHPPLLAIAFGLKTDLEFLLAGLIAAVVTTRPFLRQVMITVLAAAAAVITFGLLEALVLPADFLAHFGYGPTTVAPYQHITASTNNLRFPSTLGGANQLGTYLILPLCLALAVGLRRRPWILLLPVAGLGALAETYSRSAWIGAAAALLITLIASLHGLHRRLVLVGVGLTVVVGATAYGLTGGNLGPADYLIHHANSQAITDSSDQQHAASLREGVEQVAAAPAGHGLGSAGPATFHAGTGRIIEDSYLQIGYETGVLGLAAFLATLAALIATLWRSRRILPSVPALSALIGVGLAAIFLPAWADSSTALITLITAGAAAGITTPTRNDHVHPAHLRQA
jgi:hypothetical protein